MTGKLYNTVSYGGLFPGALTVSSDKGKTWAEPVEQPGYQFAVHDSIMAAANYNGAGTRTTSSQSSQGECKPGRYEGSFECPFPMPGFKVPAVTVTGPVFMTLEESTNGEFLEIVDGNLEGFAEVMLTPFTADLEGRLDCTTNRLEALAVDGTYAIGGAWPGTFDGNLAGDYNRTTWRLSGEWNLTEIPSGAICTGPWTADFVGP